MMMLSRFGPVVTGLVAIVIVFTVAGTTVAAESAPGITEEQALQRLLTAQVLSPEWFAEIFLAEFPVDQMQAFIGQLTGSLGAFQSVKKSGDVYEAVFDGGVLPTLIHLDDQGRIDGIYFYPPRLRAGEIDAFAAEIAALPGETSLLVVKDGQVIADHQAELPLAVGSSFKLAVLAALKEEVLAGVRSWGDVLLLTDEAKSLPTGILQEWPAGSPLTLQTLASLMISISDNTATDALIHLLGRSRVEQFSLLNRPFLTTKEAFILKNPANADALAAYRRGDEAGKRAILHQSAALPLPTGSPFLDSPVALDVEWYFSAWELCGLMAFVQDLPLMSINPGVARAADWERVAYKGGSEPGVLSLVTWLAAADGSEYCVAATWNNHDDVIDFNALSSLYGGLIDSLAAK